MNAPEGLAVYREGKRLCESPIEDRLLRMFCDEENIVLLRPDQLEEWSRRFEWNWTAIIPQYRICRYRLDFGLFVRVRDGGVAKLALECDGAEWHSSLEQVAYDKNRDGFLRRRGWHVLRMPGWRLHHAAHECADFVSLVVRHLRHRNLADDQRAVVEKALTEGLGSLKFYGDELEQQRYEREEQWV